MVGKEIRSIRCDDTIKKLMFKKCVFLTLTTPDVCDYVDIRERWRNLRHWLVRRLGKPSYIMNYEIHPKGHGWHIHAVFTCYIDLKKHLRKIRSFGFGRVDVRMVTTRFVSEYLTKHALKLYRGVKKYQRTKDFARMRLMNQSRGLPCLSDYSYYSDYLKSFREVAKFIKPKFIGCKMKFFCELPYYFGFSTYEESLNYFSYIMDSEYRDY